MALRTYRCSADSFQVLWLVYLFQVSVKLLLGLFITFGRWVKRHCVKNNPQFLREIVESFLGGHGEKEREELTEESIGLAKKFVQAFP